VPSILQSGEQPSPDTVRFMRTEAGVERFVVVDAAGTAQRELLPTIAPLVVGAPAPLDLACQGYTTPYHVEPPEIFGAGAGGVRGTRWPRPGSGSRSFRRWRRRTGRIDHGGPEIRTIDPTGRLILLK